MVPFSWVTCPLETTQVEKKPPGILTPCANFLFYRKKDTLSSLKKGNWGRKMGMVTLGVFVDRANITCLGEGGTFKSLKGYKGPCQGCKITVSTNPFTCKSVCTHMWVCTCGCSCIGGLHAGICMHACLCACMCVCVCVCVSPHRWYHNLHSVVQYLN